MITSVTIDIGSLYADLGEVIRRRRKAIGHTQAALALKLGLARASVANIECGRQKVLVHQLYQLASALQMDTSDLLPPARLDLVLPEAGAELPLPAGLSARQRAQISQLVRGSRKGSAKHPEKKE